MRLRAPRFDRMAAPAKRLILISFVIDIGAACTLLAVQFKGIKLGASPATLGTLFAANFLIYMIVCVISGHLSDRLGRRFMTIVAAAVCLIAWYGMGMVQSVAGLLLLAVLSGSGLALIWPPIEAWLADLSGNSARLLNRNIGLFNIAWTGGLMVGPLVAGQLWDAYGEGVFVVAGSTGLFCLLMAILTPTAPPADAHVAPPAHVDTRLVTRFLYMAWLVLVGCAFARGMVGGCFPNLGEALRYPKALIGKLQFMMAAGQFVAFIVTRMTQGWQYRLSPLWVCAIVSTLSMLTALVTNNPTFFGIAFAMVGASLGVTYMAGITYALSSAPEGRGKMVGFHEGIMGIGLVSGSFLGGLTAQHFGLHSPFGLAALILAIGGLGQIVVWKIRKTHT
jgi:MFS family permease